MVHTWDAARERALVAALSTEMIRCNLDVQPTITIRPGMPFTVLLRGDVVLPGPYQ